MVRVLNCLLPCFLGDCRELLLANDDKEYSKDRNELIYLIVCQKTGLLVSQERSTEVYLC